MAIFAEADVGGSSGIGWTGRQLERSRKPIRTSAAEDELLDREMARVGRLLERVAGSFEDEPSTDGRERALPDVGRKGASPTSFEPADRRLRDADPGGELCVGHAAAFARGTKLATGSCQLLPVAPGRLGEELGSLESCQSHT